MRKKAGEIPETSAELLGEITERVVGCPALSIRHIAGLGMNNAVSVVSTVDGEVVVRVNVESHLFRFEREKWVFDELKNTKVLTPEVLECGRIDIHALNGRTWPLFRITN